MPGTAGALRSVMVGKTFYMVTMSKGRSLG